MKFSFRPVKPLRVAEEIAQQLKQSIILGHFGIGDKLPAEVDLADQFQVSRTAVRDALRILKNSGFVITRQGASGGAYVTNLTFERLAGAFLDVFQAERPSLLEVFDVRSLLEPEVARRAAQRINPESAQQLKESMETPPHFHLALAEMCGNRLLECLVRSTVDLSGRIIEPTGAERAHPLSSHEQVLEAVLSGNGDAAAEAMRRHTIEAMRSFRNSGIASASPGKRSKRGRQIVDP
jgi:GntR family transcriptional regulator, transcriptional repressor for pyruvate dehydrogenase complex